MGKRKCLSQRLIQHNSGSGSMTTQDIYNRPWAVAAFICGLSHMNTRERMGLEGSWKFSIQDLQQRGYNDTFTWINAGENIVQNYNNGILEVLIRYI